MKLKRTNEDDFFSFMSDSTRTEVALNIVFLSLVASVVLIYTNILAYL